MIYQRSLITPALNCQYLEEPLLCFADGQMHIDPKQGLLQFGPKSYKPLKRHPSYIRVGFIGSAETINMARQWLSKSQAGVDGDDKHPSFPGFQKDRGFYSELIFADEWVEQFNRTEITDILNIRSSKERFEATLNLLESKLELLWKEDQKPEYILVALPDEIVKQCRVSEYSDPELGKVHRDLRRAFKAMAMKYQIPTQLLKMETIDGRNKNHPSNIAWNFFTGLYFKAGGFPWGPVGLKSGTCYIGISFYRPLGNQKSKVQTSLVQAFDENGDGLVLRGHDFTWDSEKEGTNSPHLSEEQAAQLIDLALTSYYQERRHYPQRVVVHKTSRFWTAERQGFESALRRYVAQYDLLALAGQSTARLLVANQYPPLRGTRFTIGDLDFLYTNGFIADLNQFHGGHVPSPIQIADHVGFDTPREDLLREILILTKMNWNSSRLGGLLPITIRFSQLVGDIMREISPESNPLTNFKFYT
jgi:hypothetical protein